MHKNTLGTRCLSSILAVLLGWQGIPADAFSSPGVKPRADGYAGNPLPVDLRTGALVLAGEDFSVGHDRLPLALSRVYRSDMNQSKPGIFGHGWHSILDMRVEEDGETLSLRDEQGRLRVYMPQGDDRWVSQKHEYESLRRNADGKWERHLKSGVVYRFDAESRLAEITDPNGRFIRITRLEGMEGPENKAGRTIRLEDRYGRAITVALGENGCALTAVDSAGRRCVYLHDESGNLRAFINHTGGAVAMAYDDAHRLTELNGALVYTITYGKDGRIATQRTERGVIARYDFTLGTDDTVACQITDAADGVSRIAFADGQVTVTDPTGIAENLWLNERELPVKVVGADGQTVEIRYDERANPVEIVRNGVATRLRHAPDNTLTSVESDTGASLTFSYDARRNVTDVENQRGARSVFAWNQSGLLRSAQGPTGSAVTLDYDAHGQVSTIRTGDGQTIALNFDALGLLRELTTPIGVNFRYAYDPAGRLTGVENSEGQRVRLERDALGRIVRVLDAAGNLTRMDYDPAGLLTLVRDPVGAFTRLDYDAMGRPAAYTDSNENVTRWTYDATGRLLSEVDALGEAATLTYDSQGRLNRQVNRRSQATDLHYDSAGRVVGLDQAGTPAAFAYDAFGRTVGMSNADSDFAFTLTPDGLVERVKDCKAGIDVAYKYDQAGRRIGMTAGDESVRYEYGSHGRLCAIESSAGRVSFEYDAYGRRSVMQYPNGVRTSYTYDKLNRIVEIRAVGKGGQDVSRFRYTYNVLGNRTRMIEGEDRVVNYTYDAANRLVRVTEGDEVTEYLFDDVGNRVSVIVNGEREDYFTGKDNRLLKAGGETFEYDADGNMTARIAADGKRWHYRYDAANRLVGVNGPEGRVSYAYAPNGARVSRTEGDGQPVRFVFDREDIIFEIVDGKPVARYLHGPGIDEPLALTRDGQTAFYHADALGSVQRLSDPTGTEAGRYRYDAFGKLLDAQNTIANTSTYTAREWDQAADLYFYRARFFNPNIGRFTAKDPLGFEDGANQYAYVVNSPLIYTDPSGCEREGLDQFLLESMASTHLDEAAFGGIPIAGVIMGLYDIAQGRTIKGLAGISLSVNTSVALKLAEHAYGFKLLSFEAAALKSVTSYVAHGLSAAGQTAASWGGWSAIAGKISTLAGAAKGGATLIAGKAAAVAPPVALAVVGISEAADLWYLIENYGQKRYYAEDAPGLFKVGLTLGDWGNDWGGATFYDPTTGMFHHRGLLNQHLCKGKNEIWVGSYGMDVTQLQNNDAIVTAAIMNGIDSDSLRRLLVSMGYAGNHDEAITAANRVRWLRNLTPENLSRNMQELQDWYDVMPDILARAKNAYSPVDEGSTGRHGIPGLIAPDGPGTGSPHQSPAPETSDAVAPRPELPRPVLLSPELPRPVLPKW
jgi:RHS repeat-associated protein